MRNLLTTWLIAGLSVMITAWLLPGIEVSGFGGALWAAVVIGIVNASVNPFLKLITLPISILTLGFFLLVVNAICFSLAGALAGEAIQIDGFLWSFLGAIVLTVVSSIVDGLLRGDEEA